MRLFGSSSTGAEGGLPWRRALAVFLVVATLALGVVAAVLNEHRRVMDAVDRDDMWSVTQLVLEHQRMMQMLARVQIPSSVVSREEIGLRLDILFSRKKILEEGQVARQFDNLPSFPGILAELAAALATSETALGNAALPLDGAARDMESALGAAEPSIRELLRHVTGQRDQIADEYARTSWRQVEWTVLFGGVAVVGALGLLLLVGTQSGRHAESQARFLATFNQAAVGIAHVAPDGAVLRANHKLGELLGLGERGAVGMRWQDLADPAEANAHAADWERLLVGTGSSSQCERLLRRGDGGYLWTDVTASVVRDRQGAIEYLIVVVQDASARKAAEERLRQSQRMEAIGQLTGGVAHDFNNLLGVIVGNLDLMMADVRERPKLVERLNRAISAAQRGASLTQRLLAFSRQQVLNPRRIDINAQMAEIVSLLSRTLGDSVRVKAVYASEPWPCEVDPGQLEAAVINLAVNARDAMPEGGTLTVATANVELDGAEAATRGVEPGGFVLVKIRDTGAGMPADVLRRAFEPFFTTKEVGKGSGLGLSMVYGFARQSGGFVSIDSAPGEGTTVRLYLPRAGAAAAADTPAAAGTAAARSAGGTVLVVEDHPEMRAYAVAALRQLGYRPVEAGDANMALAVLEENADISLLFTDVVLPGGTSGVGLAQAARERRSDIKVLFTTATIERSGALSLPPGDEVLMKPFRVAELAKRVAAVLGPAAGRA